MFYIPSSRQDNPRPEFDGPTVKAIGDGNIEYFRNIRDQHEIAILCKSGGGVLKLYSLLHYSLACKQFYLCKFLIMDPRWQNHTLSQVINTKTGVNIYRLAIEKDDKPLIAYYRHRLACPNAVSKSNLNKVLVTCNLLNNAAGDTRKGILGIIVNYIDPTEESMKRLRPGCSIL